MSPFLELITPSDCDHVAELSEKVAASVDVSAYTVLERPQIQKFELEDHPIDEVPTLRVSQLHYFPSITDTYLL